MELLIAILIVAVLAALLMPGTMSAMDQAKRAKCLSNLHQIYALSLHYANENDGVILSSIGLNPSVDPARSLPWDRMLQSFSGAVKSVAGARPAGIYACPASSNLVTNPSSSSSDYGKNAFINGHYLTSTVTYRMVGLSRPSEIILFGDGARDLWGHAPPYYLSARHRGLANIIYADGHGAAVNPADLPSSDSSGPPWWP